MPFCNYCKVEYDYQCSKHNHICEGSEICCLECKNLKKNIIPHTLICNSCDYEIIWSKFCNFRDLNILSEHMSICSGVKSPCGSCNRPQYEHVVRCSYCQYYTTSVCPGQNTETILQNHYSECNCLVSLEGKNYNRTECEICDKCDTFVSHSMHQSLCPMFSKIKYKYTEKISNLENTVECLKSQIKNLNHE